MNINKIYFKCKNLEETEKLVLVLLANGCYWQSGHKTIKPGDGNLMSFSDTLKKYNDDYNLIDPNDFIKNY